jgi:DNA-3-methyladenine glycosylase II
VNHTRASSDGTKPRRSTPEGATRERATTERATPERATPANLRALARRDPRLGAAMRKLPPFPAFPDATQQAMATHWDALARAIVFQQLATAAARTIHGRVCALTRADRFPSPAELLAFDEPTLRSAGLSRNKIAALRDLAQHVLDESLDLERLHHLTDDEIESQLVAVRGIGQWSAHMFLLFRLGRLDVGAHGDLGVREGLRLLDDLDERPTPKAALARMESWRPLRSVGTWLMWRLVEAERARQKPPVKKVAAPTPKKTAPAKRSDPSSRAHGPRREKYTRAK